MAFFGGQPKPFHVCGEKAHNRQRERTRHKPEDGFTLVELLIVIAVLPLVAGAIAVALIAVLSQENNVSGGLTASGDAQVVSARYVSDVQSAAWVTTKVASSSTMCGFTTSTTATQVITFSPDIFQPFSSSNPNPHLVSYVNVPIPGGTKFQLVRERCQNGNTANPSSYTVISHDLTGTQQAVISPASEQAPASTGWIQGSLVSGVKLTVTRTSTNNTYTLTAVPRVWNPANVGQPPIPPILPLTLLGQSCSPTAPLALSGASTKVDVENGSGTPGTGNLGFSSTCSSPISNNGGATLQAASPPVSAIPNPLANLSPPTTHPSTAGNGTCSTSGGTTTCTTGYYASAPSVSATTVFDPTQGPNAETASSPAIFVFANNVHVTSHASVTFKGGSDATKVIYWFQQGLTVDGGSSVTFGSATYLLGDDRPSDPPAGTCCLSINGGATILQTNQTAGMLLYVEAGPATYDGGSNTPISGSSAYEGLAIWDAVACSPGTLSCALTLSGGSTLSTPLGGIYDPNGWIQFTGGSPMNTEFIVADYATFSGGTKVTILG